MIKFNIQLFGGRGGSSGAGGGGGAGGGSKFANESDFEKSLSGFNDPRLKEYEDGLSEGVSRVGELNNLKNFAKNEGLSDWTKAALEGELKKTKSDIKNMPKEKTPKQLGKLKGLQDVEKALTDLLNTKPSGNKTPTDDSILV